MFDRKFQELANIIDLIADLMMCSVCACMQTQHKLELDARDDGTGKMGRNPAQYLYAGLSNSAGSHVQENHASPYGQGSNQGYGAHGVSYAAVVQGHPSAPQPIAPQPIAPQTGYTISPIAPQQQTMS
eukprot:CAMPEP_0196585658 /NCGR_PEP_ID=MMETSP1081-20130531/51503_1 /TAXON_ID=36882 /ORGANISM="Pyramimonas amylifera, Strain CCMP720" /LENGTH=127 /DNA_ID=CAMNT_0041907275 /DNA_START=490 /DNA_END=873 /DNA_ORIENTATION=+